MRWDKDYMQHEEGDWKSWYQELPFIGEGVDLILARRVWSLIYVPLMIFSTWFVLSSLWNLPNDWWHIPIGIIGMFWSTISLHFIWVDA